MSFWSKLGKIALGAGGIAAAPFTGGASAATILPAVLGGAGAALGGMSEASASNRGAQVDAATQAEILNRERQDAFVRQAIAREAQRFEFGKDAYGREKFDAVVRLRAASLNPSGDRRSAPVCRG